MEIPNRLIFIWFGKDFPYANLLAMRSARKQCRPGEIVLLAEHPDLIRNQLGESAHWPELRIATASADLIEGLPAAEVAAGVFANSGHAPTKANLLRLAELYLRGGIYLDFDTITLRDLAPLRRLQLFCGVEPVVFPLTFLARKSPFKWPRAVALLALREVLARLPGGWRAFRRVEGLYDSALNNAILGAVPGHPFLEKCFRAIGDLPPDQLHRRFRLGTHLLQQIAADGSGTSISVLPAAAFYPLGPEISNHWFRPGTAASIPEMVSESTFVVHWYNSVERRFLKEILTEKWVEAHPDTAFAELARLHG